MINFALIGAAGYVAPRHMKAIKETGNNLVAAVDTHDSVGVLDSYFPKCEFFTEIERFDRYLELLKREGKGIDYLSICSPNYLHDAHCRLGMRVGADVICEKPLVLFPINIEQLAEVEKETGKKIYNILQLRYHPELLKLKENLPSGMCRVNIKYITPRGPWYDRSWKGDIEKSGGIITNIGIHLFDMLMWIFGNQLGFVVNTMDKHTVEGTVYLDRAKANFLLSTDSGLLPEGYNDDAFREITVNDEPISMDKVFTDLHTDVYSDIMKEGGGYGIEDAKPSIELVYKIRRKYKL